MYRWTDPIEPDGVPRRPEPPTDEGPAWLTDRPEPRSSYLFGDEPGQPGPDRNEPTTGAWRADAPATPWRDDHTPERTGHLPSADAGTHGWAAAGPYADADRTGYSPAVEPPAYGPAAHPGGPMSHYEAAPTSPYERAGGWHPEEQHTAWQQPVDERTGAWQGAEDRSAGSWQPGADAADDETGRHRERRRLRRPLLIGGAAAAATLVVSLGVGALVLPDGDQPTEPTSADGPVAAAPLATDGAEEAPADALAPESASPSAAPTSAKPTPTKKPTPKPSRTTAPSRQSPRSTAPSNTGATTTSAKGLTAELRQVVDLVNQERAKAGCKALTVDDKLTLAAQRHSQDQADHKKMTHDGSDGSDVGDRLDRVGYAWRSYGENVAWNQQSPAAVMDAWMNSPGHRANILNCSFTEIGVGVARSNGPYWTQDFGTPR